MSDNKNIDTNSRNFSKLKEVIKKIWESKERKDATEIASKINTTDLIEIGYYNLVGSEDDTLLDKTSKKSVANLIDYTVTNGAKAINLDALKNVDALKNMPELGTLGKNLTIIPVR